MSKVKHTPFSEYLLKYFVFPKLWLGNGYSSPFLPVLKEIVNPASSKSLLPDQLYQEHKIQRLLPDYN